MGDKQRAYYGRNKKKISKKQQEWADANPEKVRASQFRYYLKKRYGMTVEQWEKILADQSNGCAICGGPSGKREFSIDHDHHTGLVRGLLCGNCNTGLGIFKDSVDLLDSASHYLRTFFIDQKA